MYTSVAVSSMNNFEEPFATTTYHTQHIRDFSDSLDSIKFSWSLSCFYIVKNYSYII